MDDKPRNYQFVEVNILGWWEEGRYFENHIGCGDRPGYDLRGGRYVAAEHVRKWRDASDIDPLGYDMSMREPTHDPATA